MRKDLIQQESVEAETYKGYIRRLIDEFDYEKLGEGGFGTVLQHPTMRNVVVKVVKMDRAYRKFCKFAMDNPTNPWLPKIASVQTIALDDANLAYAVFMEKLDKVPASYVEKLREAFRDRYNLRFWSDNQWFDRASWRKIAADSPPDFSKLATYFADNLNSLDLIPSNFMRRRNQLVFNDPVAG